MLSVLDNSRALYLSIFNFVGFYKDGYLYSCSREVTFYIVHPCLWRALPTIFYFHFDTDSRPMPMDYISVAAIRPNRLV